MYSPVPQQYRKPHFQNADLIVLGVFLFFLYGTVVTAQRWDEALQPDIHIDLGTTSLVLYSVYSFFRALIAYMLSLTFTLVFGYLAAKYKAAERIILPLLDIGQSIPVLGFLPGLVLGLIAVFPHTSFGLELACILMIFTGQVWNMTFSFYSSVKSVPKHFYELSDNVGLNFFQKFYLVELPYSSSGLAWNSLMSMAGGWFFLTVCEAFTLGDKPFRLPGLGSYMALAIEQGNHRAMISGVVAMVILIVGMDFFIWRPIIAWTRRFQLDEQQDAPQEIPYFQKLIQESKLVRAMENIFRGIFRSITSFARSKKKPKPVKRVREQEDEEEKPSFHIRRLFQNKLFRTILPWIIFPLLGAWISAKLYIFIEPLTVDEIILILKSALVTFLRVIFALVISTLWTVPFGLWVGLSAKRTQFVQPIIQVAASFPAPMLYPIALGILAVLHIPIMVGASVLILLGVQWYVLFNVLAGTTMISRELRDTFRLIRVGDPDTWKTLYLPSILPALVTGWVTAAGGAWNASIVAEYIQYKGETLQTLGLGALISDATAHANYPLLAGSLLCMVVVVIGFNRLVWHKLYQLVERKYKFER